MQVMKRSKKVAARKKRKMPARYKTGPKKGQFKPSKRRKNPVRSTSARAGRTSSASARAGRGAKGTTSRAGSKYSSRVRSRPAKRKARRTARRNAPMTGIWNVAATAAIATVAQGFGAPFLSKWMGPAGAKWTATAAIGATGWWMLGKAKTKPAGYALLGIATGDAVAQLLQMWLMPSGIPSQGGYVPASSVVRNLPYQVNVPTLNPVGAISVPSY